MLPAGPNSAKPRSFLGYEGDDGTHGYFRLERLALAWPHAVSNDFPLLLGFGWKQLKNTGRDPLH